MLTMTCPGCNHTATTPPLPSGTVVTCPGCQAQLRVVGTREPPPPGSAALYFVFGLLGGLALAAVIVLLWFFLGRDPAANPLNF